MNYKLLTVYRPAYGDCTNHGISSRQTLMFLFDDCTAEEALALIASKNISPDECLIADHSPSCGRPYLKAVPLVRKRKGLIGPMFGGNILHDDVDDVFVPIHDRYETQEEYDILSR